MHRATPTARACSVIAALLFAATPVSAEPDPAEPPVAWREPVLYSLAGMGAGIVGLVATRQTDDDPSLDNFTGAFASGPRRDDDPPIYNWVLHPLWGSETYLRAREAHMGVVGSFAFSLGASVAWEYLVESWTEHPSVQDLVLTTGVGWMLGELRHQLKQRLPEERHLWVDPIHTGLERFGLGVGGASDGEPKLRMSYRF